LSVNRGELCVRTGRGEDAHEERYSRAHCPFDRLLLVGPHGVLTIAALRWLRDVRVSLLVIDGVGRVTATSAPTLLDDPRVRRTQALAPWLPVGLTIAQHLVRAKLEGQAETLALIPASAEARTIVLGALARLDAASTIREVRSLEAEAAEGYWRSWAAVPFRFARRDRVPKHWRVVGPRGSPLSGSPRRAVTPAHALRNLLLGVLEGQARIACQSLSLDGGLGVLHSDQRARQSLVCDLVEPGRPQVDQRLLVILTTHVFRRSDFCEEPDGHVRVAPNLARDICQAVDCRDLLASHAEHIAQLLADTRLSLPQGVGEPAPIRMPTRLTEARRSAARTTARARSQRRPAPRLPGTCIECGAALEDPNRVRCDTCHVEWNRARLQTYASTEAHRRTVDGHPSSRSDVRDRIAATQRKHWKARSDADEVSGFGASPSAFNRLILPKLRHVAPAEMATATHLSVGYCAQIRDGKRVPHARHWGTLQLVGLQAEEQARA
jgi:CRISPR-associated endonuclease Cas1